MFEWVVLRCVSPIVLFTVCICVWVGSVEVCSVEVCVTQCATNKYLMDHYHHLYSSTSSLHLYCLGGQNHWSAWGLVVWSSVSRWEGIPNLAEAQQKGWSAIWFCGVNEVENCLIEVSNCNEGCSSRHAKGAAIAVQVSCEIFPRGCVWGTSARCDPGERRWMGRSEIRWFWRSSGKDNEKMAEVHTMHSMQVVLSVFLIFLFFVFLFFSAPLLSSSEGCHFDRGSIHSTRDSCTVGLLCCERQLPHSFHPYCCFLCPTSHSFFLLVSFCSYM